MGVGGVGGDYVIGCKSEEIVALCDLDPEYAAPVFKLYPKAKIYKDFRQMFDKERKNFDALIVATPDHWHSHLVLAGLAMNKHIYCAKPMTRAIAEARRAKAAALASKATTKASIQDSRSSPARATTELLLSGAIGPIREVHFWTGTHSPSGLARPKEVQTPPAGMNWDQWCGPSPARPYHEMYHYGNWRPWWDFGTGNLGDVACHALHVFHDELEMGAPDWVAADACQAFSPGGVVENSECASIANYVQWHFPARGKHPEMMAYFYDGGLQPPRPLSMRPEVGMPGRGMMFVGEKGVQVSAFYGGLLGTATLRRYSTPGERGTTGWGRNGRSDSADVWSTTGGAHPGVWEPGGADAPRYWRSSKVLLWDSKAMKFSNDEVANGLVDMPYRKEWDYKV